MPIQSFKLPVSHGHTLHVELAGKPDGIPVLFLHGGPGAGINGNYQWPFDQDHYRIIAFDQRACGQSQPFGSLENNTTQDLVEDIEALRQHLKIENWMVFGGSWGATLALCYAIAHPHRVNAMILRGVFLARQQDFDWFLQPTGGASQIFPDAYQDFISQIPSSKQYSSDIADAFYQLFLSEHELISQKALSAWFNWEGAISKLLPDEQRSSEVASNQQVKSLALLECHYLRHHCFIEENYILNNVAKIRHIPTHIVHGRYDMVCTIAAAHQLSQALANCSLTIVDNAGHSAAEKGIKTKLISIMRNLQQSAIEQGV